MRVSLMQIRTGMLNRTRISVVAAVASFSVFAAQNPPAVPLRLAPGFDAIRESTLRADLTFLASDSLQGRLSLQPGDAVAVQWIAEFAKAGLKPGNGDGYLQPFDLIEYRPDRARSYVALERDG